MGYGMMPWAVSVIVMTTFGGILFVIAFIVPSTISPLEEYAQFGYALYPYFSLIILFWGCCLWIPAVMHTHGFSFWKAVVVLIGPVVIIIWLTIPVQEFGDTIRMLVSGT
jgi:hypothetical protein